MLCELPKNAYVVLLLEHGVAEGELVLSLQSSDYVSYVRSPLIRECGCGGTPVMSWQLGDPSRGHGFMTTYCTSNSELMENNLRRARNAAREWRLPTILYGCKLGAKGMANVKRAHNFVCKNCPMRAMPATLKGL